MNKKIVRIIAIILVAVTLMGFIIPYVSATEIEDENTTTVESSESGNDVETNEENLQFFGIPPEGFELVDADNYIIRKTNSNMNVWFQIPIAKDTPRIDAVIFVVDIAKNAVVEQVKLSANEMLVNGLKLSDGYYALISGGYAFSDGTHNYEINNGQPSYFYIGDTYKFDRSLYDVQFHIVDDNAIQLSLNVAGEGAVVKNINEAPIYNSEVSIPYEITKLSNNDIEEVKPNQNQTEPSNPDPSEPIKPVEKEEKEFFLITVFKNSWIWLLLLGGAYAALKVIENKKKDQLTKNIESDRNDAGRFE